MVKDIIEVLEADPVVYLIHLEVILEEVFMLPAFQDLKATRLCALDVVCHQASLYASLQDELGRGFQRGRGVYMLLRGVSRGLLRVVVRCELPYRSLGRRVRVFLLRGGDLLSLLP